MDLHEIPPELVQRIAEDAIGLTIEYRDDHGYDEQGARAFAVAEVVEGCRVDVEGLRREEHGLPPVSPIVAGILRVPGDERAVYDFCDRMDAARRAGPGGLFGAFRDDFEAAEAACRQRVREYDRLRGFGADEHGRAWLGEPPREAPREAPSVRRDLERLDAGREPTPRRGAPWGPRERGR